MGILTGDSSRAKQASDYNVNILAETIVECIELIKPQSLSVFAHSYGGDIFIKSLKKIKYIDRVVLSGCPPLESLASLAIAYNPQPIMTLTAKATVDKGDIEIVKDAFKMHSIETPSFVVDCWRNTHGAFREGLAYSIQNGMIESETEILLSSPSKVLLMNGEHDAAINKPYMEGIAKLLKADSHLIQNGGHLWPYEYPELLHQAFLS